MSGDGRRVVSFAGIVMLLSAILLFGWEVWSGRIMHPQHLWGIFILGIGGAYFIDAPGTKGLVTLVLRIVPWGSRVGDTQERKITVKPGEDADIEIPQPEQIALSEGTEESSDPELTEDEGTPPAPGPRGAPIGVSDPLAGWTAGDQMVGRYFRLREFAVSASHPELVERVPDRLVARVRNLVTGVLDPIRRWQSSTVSVLSGYRSPTLNRAVKGSPTSQHVYAEAADLQMLGVEECFRALLAGKVPGVTSLGQCIYYPSRNFIHTALQSLHHPSPEFQVHEPTRGLRYQRVRTEKELDAALERARS